MNVKVVWLAYQGLPLRSRACPRLLQEFAASIAPAHRMHAIPWYAKHCPLSRAGDGPAQPGRRVGLLLAPGAVTIHGGVGRFFRRAGGLAGRSRVEWFVAALRSIGQAAPSTCAGSAARSPNTPDCTGANVATVHLFFPDCIVTARRLTDKRIDRRGTDHDLGQLHTL
jgi:hypothetical protein